MPHIIIEHSASLQCDLTHLTQSIHQSTIETNLFDEQTIKTRRIAFAECILGDGKQDFVHIQVHLLVGRKQAQKQMLSEKLLNNLKSLLPESVSLSVHPYDLDPAIYRKN
ncbi:5-carboxymethyl-2-hydroxymuconate Delta-isomerase [Pseudoalteromonas umbrosa]|uniref:5-carboxymethyl-2-hydroxymuconate Delta-isomerase n=1 Tax=Pseudoalteromonas umbrosa TaxID=3048489 RepID=UPI0024C42A24|nr:5-carboxymethyl-2-hydroxymuconate isomerase [Pseudoalteromonas sp. B95]MDK1289480.1 5-carboxymethyl-2-hydroxymuconate isomerase [Pseudoalteromonas sp. B95]